MVNSISNEEPLAMPESMVQTVKDTLNTGKAEEVKPYVIEKITRSCDRSISVNFQTYKVATTLSATIKNPKATKEELDAISAEIYSMAEAQTLAEINKIAQALGR